MKLLLYCTKAKPYLIDERKIRYNNFVLGDNSILKSNEKDLVVNGKIVAECDFEVEKITNFGTSFMIMKYDDLQESYRYTNKIARGSCLNYTDLRRYLGTNDGYAIHIKNLHIFDKPKIIQDYSKNENPYNYIEKAPQNMMYVFDVKSFNESEKKVLISIKPEWLCKILNGEKTIEVRKKVLKEMK